MADIKNTGQHILFTYSRLKALHLYLIAEAAELDQGAAKVGALVATVADGEQRAPVDDSFSQVVSNSSEFFIPMFRNDLESINQALSMIDSKYQQSMKERKQEIKEQDDKFFLDQFNNAEEIDRVCRDKALQVVLKWLENKIKRSALKLNRFQVSASPYRTFILGAAVVASEQKLDLKRTLNDPDLIDFSDLKLDQNYLAIDKFFTSCIRIRSDLGEVSPSGFRSPEALAKQDMKSETKEENVQPLNPIYRGLDEKEALQVNKIVVDGIIHAYQTRSDSAFSSGSHLSYVNFQSSFLFHFNFLREQVIRFIRQKREQQKNGEAKAQADIDWDKLADTVKIIYDQTNTADYNHNFELFRKCVQANFAHVYTFTIENQSKDDTKQGLAKYDYTVHSLITPKFNVANFKKEENAAINAQDASSVRDWQHKAFIALMIVGLLVLAAACVLFPPFGLVAGAAAWIATVCSAGSGLLLGLGAVFGLGSKSLKEAWRNFSQRHEIIAGILLGLGFLLSLALLATGVGAVAMLIKASLAVTAAVAAVETATVIAIGGAGVLAGSLMMAATIKGMHTHYHRNDVQNFAPNNVPQQQASMLDVKNPGPSSRVVSGYVPPSGQPAVKVVFKAQ